MAIQKGVLAVILIALVVLAAYAIYTQMGSKEVATETLERAIIYVIDGTGRNVTVKLPVERVVSLNSGITELLYALNCGDKIIGRDALSTFPPQVLEKRVVGGSSYDPNVELIVELQPDLVLADDMLFYNQEALTKIEKAGIPVIMENTSNVTRIKAIITNLGIILDSKSRAQEIVSFIEFYENLVAERVRGIPPDKKPLVYIEWYTAWQSFAKGSAGDKIIFDAGGINIAAEIDQPAPILSPEFVVGKNPDIILRMAPSEAKGNVTAFKAVRDEILARPELKTVKAVKSEKVYVYDPILLEGVRYPAGLLYWAKCFHPEVFADIDPEAVHSQIMQKFLGMPLEGVYFYPSLPSTKPVGSPQSEISEKPVSVIDWQGVTVTLQAPAKTVISLSSGFTELIYALGCGDKLIGRDSYSKFPPDVLNKPVVAPHSYNPPLELILELKPDLLVSNTNLVYDNNETRRKLEEAGIAVYIDELSRPDRVKICIRNLGILLGVEAKAEEIINLIEGYESLVQRRLAGVKESDKPKVYLELFREWNTVAMGSVGHSLLEFVGAINIAADLPTPYPIVSPEYVVSKNPDVIIRMKMFWDPDFPTLWEKLMSRPELQGVSAVKNKRVYLYDPSITQGVMYPVGILYWAKWLYPDRFADVDPGAIHALLLQKYFGVTLDRVYVYP